MKKALVILAFVGLLGGMAEARTWTSADGSKTFEGTLKSYDPASGIVTVIVAGRPTAFPKDKLSEGDIAFLSEPGAAAPGAATPAVASAPSESAATSAVVALVAKAKLQQLDGKRFKKAESIKSPDYYVLYYSASW